MDNATTSEMVELTSPGTRREFIQFISDAYLHTCVVCINVKVKICMYARKCEVLATQKKTLCSILLHVHATV